MNENLRIVCDYMHYAFLPTKTAAIEKAQFYRNILTDDTIETFDPTDSGSARRLAATILRERLQERNAMSIKMGVTAGLDSRTLLGVALDVLKPENIIAYTSGQPGNRDVELARWFTESILPTHYIISTHEEAEYDIEQWVRYFENRHPPGFPGTLSGTTRVTDNPLSKHAHLDTLFGYLGDTLSGKRLHGKLNLDWRDAVESFVRKNHIFSPADKRLIDRLTPPDYDPYHVIPDEPLLPFEIMSFDDQLDLCYRQHQRIRRTFKPYTAEETGGDPRYEIIAKKNITIYDDPRWQRSYLTMDASERINQNHYKRTLTECWPHIFQDLVSPDDPRFRKAEEEKDSRRALERHAATSLHTNWERLWLQSESFNRFARELMESVAARGFITWFDPREIIEEIDRDVLGLGRIIWCLCSVELNIRAGRLPDPAAGSAGVRRSVVSQSIERSSFS